MSFFQRAFVVLALVVLVLVPHLSQAANDLEWVEVELHIDAQGVAEVHYAIRWRSEGGMHGFYFEGEAGEPRWLTSGCVAELPSGENVPLDISSVGPGRWDVVLGSATKAARPRTG